MNHNKLSGVLTIKSHPLPPSIVGSGASVLHFELIGLAELRHRLGLGEEL